MYSMLALCSVDKVSFLRHSLASIRSLDENHRRSRDQQDRGGLHPAEYPRMEESI